MAVSVVYCYVEMNLDDCYISLTFHLKFLWWGIFWIFGFNVLFILQYSNTQGYFNFPSIKLRPDKYNTTLSLFDFLHLNFVCLEVTIWLKNKAHHSKELCLCMLEDKWECAVKSLILYLAFRSCPQRPRWKFVTCITLELKYRP